MSEAVFHCPHVDAGAPVEVRTTITADDGVIYGEGCLDCQPDLIKALEAEGIDVTGDRVVVERLATA